jgi:hypothetical protein
LSKRIGVCFQDLEKWYHNLFLCKFVQTNSHQICLVWLREDHKNQ